MAYDLALLEAEFLVPESPKDTSDGRARELTSLGSKSAYQRRLASLFQAHGHRFERCLEGKHDYPSDSEASMAAVCAMVARHFTDYEIWLTLEGSELFRHR